MSVGESNRSVTRLVLVLVVGVLFALVTESVAHAQVVGATVNGTVIDPSGGVVAGATVLATNTATAVSREVMTDSAGIYTIPNLIPGPYDMRVSATGFSTIVQSGVTLSVGQQLQLNFPLKVGQTSSEVNVTGAAPQIELTSSANTGEVQSEMVRQLPLNGRRTNGFARASSPSHHWGPKLLCLVPAARLPPSDRQLNIDAIERMRIYSSDD